MLAQQRTTAPARSEPYTWREARAVMAAADALAEDADSDIERLEEFFRACDVSAQAREEMWTIAPPSMAALAWKLKEAMIAEGVGDDPVSPLARVLRDLERLADGQTN